MSDFLIQDGKPLNLPISLSQVFVLQIDLTDGLNKKCKKKSSLPCLCSWGRKSDRLEGTCLIPTASDYWLAGKTGSK